MSQAHVQREITHNMGTKHLMISMSDKMSLEKKTSSCYVIEFIYPHPPHILLFQIYS